MMVSLHAILEHEDTYIKILILYNGKVVVHISIICTVQTKRIFAGQSFTYLLHCRNI